MSNTVDESRLCENTHHLTLAAEKGDVHRVRELIPLSNPNSYEWKSALIWASTNGNAEILKALIEASDITRGDIFATLMRNVEVYEHAECLEVLLPYIRSLCHNSDIVLDELFVSAATNETENCLNVLLPHVDPKRNGSVALKRAVEGKHTACIEFLTPLSDTNGIDATQQLLEAVETQTMHCIKVLLPLCRTLHETNVLTEVLRHHKHPEEILQMVAPFCDPSYNDSEALFFAVKNELTQSVAVLAKVCDVSAANSRALALAEEKFLKPICEILYENSDLRAAWETLNERLSWLKKEDIEEYKQNTHPRLYELMSIQEQQAMLTHVALLAQNEQFEKRRNKDVEEGESHEEQRRRKM